jgi:DNA-binding response OmpR family regulator
MKKILIIEDEKDLREALQAILITQGYLVKTSETAEEGLQSAIADTPDLILLDVMTHSLHASVFLERLRNYSPETHAIKVVVLTNLDNDVTRQKVQTFGIEAYLVKSSTSLEEVVEIVKGIVP